MTFWFLLLLGLIVVAAFAVVAWAWAPANARRIEHDARLPLEDVGESDLDEDEGGAGRNRPAEP